MQGNSLLFTTCCPLILASTSPRRHDFFKSIGLSFQTITPPPDAEPSPASAEDPVVYALRAATAKAQAVHSLLEQSPIINPSRQAETNYAIIAADTVVVQDGNILGKPADADHALKMLKRLAGRTHKVVSACAILQVKAGTACLKTFHVESLVTFWDCPENILRAYADSEEPLDKAGGYAVQGQGAFLVKSIQGSWSNVVGLPMSELVAELLNQGIISLVK